MLTTQSLKKSLSAGLLAVGICVLTSGNTLAGDCGCEPSCGACPTSSSSSCDCSGGCSSPGADISRAVKKSCVYKALDLFAGGVEKLLGLDKCGNDCDELTCDDGCDAAMIDELMVPPAIEQHHHFHAAPAAPSHVHMPSVQPAPIHIQPLPQVQIAPQKPSEWQQPRMAPRETEMRMSEPRMVEPRIPAPIHPKEQSMREPEPKPLQDSRIPVPVPVPKMEERAAPQEEADDGGSLFDTLTNPFSDDEARVHVPQPIRPSSYESSRTYQPSKSDYNMRPISKRPLSRSYSESTRRVRSVR